MSPVRQEQSWLIALIDRHRRTVLWAASLAGLAAAWLAVTPFGLLAPLLAVFLRVRDTALFLTHAALAVAFTVTALTVMLQPDGTDGIWVSWAAFFAIALCIGAIVAASLPAFARSDAVQAMRIIESMPAHTWSATADGRTTWVSAGTLAYTGQPMDGSGLFRRLDNAGWRRIVHPDDYAPMLERRRHSLASGTPYDAEFRIRGADGEYRWFRCFGSASRDGRGRITGWYGTMIEIEEQKRAQEALRRDERRLQQLIDAVPALIWSADREGTPSYINKRIADVVGVTLKDLTDPDEPLTLADIHPDDRPAVEQALTRSFETGADFVMTYRQRRADGTYRWTEGRAEPLRDQAGCIVQWYGVCVDIDERMVAQEALSDREHELSQLVDMIPSHVWRLRPDGEPVFFNKQMTDFLGMTVADTDRPDISRLEAFVETIHPDDAPPFRDALHHSLATGECFGIRYRLRRVDGVYRWMSSRAAPLRDQSGRIVQWFGLCHDIDEQMRLYSDIEEREARIRRLVDSDIIGIVIWDLDGTLIDANNAFLRMVQYEREDLQAGLRWFDMTPPEWQDVHARDEAEELMATGKMQAREKEYFRKDGSRVPVLIGAACFEGQSRQGVAYILDLTESKRAEAALRDRERELARLVDTVPVQIWSVAPGGDPAYINKTMIDYIGLELEDFDVEGGLPSAIQTIVHPDDRESLLQGLTHSFNTGERFELKFRNRRRDGEFRWTEGHADPLHDESGRIIRWYGANVDIHDHVTSQEALRERERFLWQLVETLPAMIDCAAPDGEPVYRSQQLREFLGYNLEDLDAPGASRLAGTLDAGVHPDDLAGVKRAYARSLSTGEPYARRHRLRRFDGAYRWVETRAAPMRDAEGTIVQWNVICLDIDGEVQAQEELRLAREGLAHASQVATLSELSASIAHEVNQPLAAIVANSHACHRWLSAEPANVERAKITAERIIRDANSAADVVSRIRALFRRSPATRVPTDYGSVIVEARALLADEAARHRVRMETDVESRLPLLALDRVQIQQVLVNLVRNGIEAMDAAATGRELRIRASLAGDMVQTEVSDTGPGLELPDAMFEPFFTTKDRGMGMGLAICRSIVESHGGRLWAEKNQPHGATFIFTLPIVQAATP